MVPKNQLSLFPEGPKLPTQEQVSSGGVAFRAGSAETEVALISVGKENRWQLPKGLVDADETPETTAVREVKEETGLSTEVIKKLDTISYWYVGNKGEQRVRFHKLVHFYLMAYLTGQINEHDWEVNEARWVPLGQALKMLHFKSERQVLDKAQQLIAGLGK